MRRRLRCAVIGLGWAGGVHCRVLRELDGVDLVAVADTDAALRASYDGIPAVPGIEDLLAHDLDYCVIATPTTTHERLGLALADAGIHALIEKPLADSLPAALRLTTAFDSAGLIASVGHTERRNSAITDVATRLAHGEFGDIYQVSTHRQGPFPDRIKDVGVIQDLAIHDVDLTAFLTGRPVVQVTAHALHVSGSEHEDLATAVCRLQGDLPAIHHVNRISPLKERLTLVHTARGCVVADALAFTVTVHTNGTPPSLDGFPGVTIGPTTSWHTPRREPFVLEHQAMRDAVLGLPADIVTLRQGAAAVGVTEATLASARTGRLTPVTPHVC